MDRREALRILATGAALQLAPGNLLSVLREARALAGSQAAPRALNPHQDATVKAMAEMILPRTDTPGAADVGAAEFIDLILADWCVQQERALFLNGLADVDERSQTLFSQDFVECSAVQQADILNALGEKMEQEERMREQGHSPEAPPEPERRFYPMLRQLTLTAYYTSEAGATQELNFQIIPDRHDGCAAMQSGKQGQESQ
ncbi:MAG TPA: gluconate 2-dehydrogenase subunit 3 family protein [Candidatus Sulfotelmatobacter sp.]|nr:gluconate 2-dehydrogenase subunit 3 family protein [Candidatus Sulfotelmatobacter sp.]